MSRAERRRAETRARITEAARALVVEHGVSALRLSDIADRADVAFGSIYTYFDSKEAVVDAVVTTTLQALLQASAPPTESYDDPAEEVAAAARRIVRVVYDNRELAQALMTLEQAQERFVAILAARSQQLLDRGVATGRFRIIDTAAVTAYLLAGGFELIRGVLDGRIGDNADIICADTALRAVGIDPEEAQTITHRAR